MRRSVALLILAAACAPADGAPAVPPSLPPAVVTAGASMSDVDTLGPDLTVRRLAGRVWLHVSVENGIPSNGLIVETDDGGSLLIDTAWDDDQTGRLVEWARTTLGKPIRRAVPTHFHEDRLGGIDTLRKLGIPMAGLDLTRTLAQARGKQPLPDVYLTAAQGARADAEGIEVFYPGPGHSRDNVVVWLPRERVLFGGCLLKAAATRDMGNVADADIPAWPATVARVMERYPSAAVVVPGHGAPGGFDVLTHTRALVTAAGRAGGG